MKDENILPHNYEEMVSKGHIYLGWNSWMLIPSGEDNTQPPFVKYIKDEDNT